MSKLQPKDIVAILIISGLILFKLTGHNGSLDTPAALIIGYYFAKRESGRDIGA